MIWNATIKASAADDQVMIRLENGAAIDLKNGVCCAWAPGGHLMYEGVSLARALARAEEIGQQRKSPE